MEAARTLAGALPECEIVDCFKVLERLRARKTPEELTKLREASERVTDSMLAVIRSHGEGSTKNEIVAALRKEETMRGLDFEYCLISAGPKINRAPSDQPWLRGEALSIDSGGSYQGYIGDLARMAVIGEPDNELVDLLAEVEAIQRAVTVRVRPGIAGGDLYDAAEKAIAQSPHRTSLKFLAHGVGMISHEIPHLTTQGPVPYEASDAHRPLEAGMVLSIETDLSHRRRGFIKIEDTVAVTEKGFEIFGERGRGWNIAGGA
jgi:Xaa-Pro aminopeptidase